jgi:HPt (histidine-containing phosphotransfer) domain-containing protein
MTLDEKKSTPDLTAALDQLWMRFLPEMHQRAAILESAAVAFASGEITSEQKYAAHSAAHKLAGTLGTFGLARGSELARDFEKSCSPEEPHTRSNSQHLVAIAAEISAIIAARK